MSKKKILVTGGAGFIGAHTVVELTAAGYQPVIVDNLSRSDRTLLEGTEKILKHKTPFYEGDCADRNFLSKVFETEKDIEGAMHFAAYKSVGESVQFPAMYYSNNLNSLITLLNVMKDFGVRDLIFSSSCTVYGEPDQIPVNEDAPMKRAESPYGATKQMCERILEDVYLHGMRIVSLRYFNPIGAHPTAMIGELPIGVPANLVPYITQTAIGKRPGLTVFGNDYNTPDGSCIRDFIHVVDVAQAHIKAMEFLSGQTTTQLYKVLNLGTGVGVSVLELLNTFEKVTGIKLNYTIGPRRPGDVEKTYADPAKAFKELQWKPKFSIEDGLLHAWQWEQKLAKA
ncbi:MAG TPA: UDP-glucose 4-epimerase GalE [Cyclobacteriaceae bacterium]|nr:UDP-glucose 4-epimerase GalE [Cyclobacteriaceae bacterium]